MFRAVLIGCGNIGAMYDYNNDHVLTHAKALYKSGKFSVKVFDIDQTLANKVAKKYNYGILLNLDGIDSYNTDLVIIATPTASHYKYLKLFLHKNINTIICEKPVSNDIEELNDLSDIYKKSSSKIFVNYFRNFQASFLKLKEYISGIRNSEKLTNISIRYHRGFLNNCSHAFALLQYLIDYPFELANVKCSRPVFDEFKDDPTLSIFGVWNNININVIGLSEIKFSIFEVELTFINQRIMIVDAGNKIEFYKAVPNSTIYKPLIKDEILSSNNCIDDYMLHVINNVQLSLDTDNNRDNFIESLRINEGMLTILREMEI